LATSVLPPRTAPTETAISGELVPSAPTVSPTTSGDRPNDTASFDAPRTSNSAPTTSATTPAANRTRVMSAATSGREPESTRTARLARASPRKAWGSPRCPPASCRRQRAGAPLLVGRDVGQRGLRDLDDLVVQLVALRIDLDEDRDRRAADAHHVGVEAQHVADEHRLLEQERVDRDRGDPPVGPAHR